MVMMIVTMMMLVGMRRRMMGCGGKVVERWAWRLGLLLRAFEGGIRIRAVLVRRWRLAWRMKEREVEANGEEVEEVGGGG